MLHASVDPQRLSGRRAGRGGGAGADSGQPGALPVCSRPARCYFAWALLLGVGQLACAVSFFVRLSEQSARRLLLASLIYLPAADGAARAGAVGLSFERSANETFFFAVIRKAVTQLWPKHLTMPLRITPRRSSSGTDARTAAISSGPAASQRQADHVAVPVDRDHVLRRPDRHVHRAALRRPDLARAARRAPERADRRVQHVRADLLQRDHRAGAWKRPGPTRPAPAKGWMLVTLRAGQRVPGREAVRVQRQVLARHLSLEAAQPDLRKGRSELRRRRAAAARSARIAAQGRRSRPEATSWKRPSRPTTIRRSRKCARRLAVVDRTEGRTSSRPRQAAAKDPDAVERRAALDELAERHHAAAHSARRARGAG